MFAVHNGKCYTLGCATSNRERGKECYSGFPRMQSGMLVILRNTIFNYCNFNVYLYIFTRGPYIQVFLVWTFMPKKQNFNHSILLILYSIPPDLKCMKWTKCTLCSDWCTKLFSFTVHNYRPKRLVNPAVLRMSESCIGSMYAEITFWRHFKTPERKQLNRGSVPCSSDSALRDPTP